MATRLVSEVTVTDLAPSAVVVREHGLNVRGFGRKPARIFPGHGDLEISDVTATTITITNTGAAAVTATIQLEVWHSGMRAYGGAAPYEPYVVRGGGAGGSSGGGGSSFVANPTVATGNEDTVINGSVLTNVSSPTGTLSVQQFIVPGTGSDPSTTYGANSTASVTGRGSLTVRTDGTFTFTPLPNFSGSTPPVIVWVSNGQELRTTTLSCVIAAVNDPPTVRNAYGLSLNGEAVDIDILALGNDIEGDTLTVALIEGAPPIVNLTIGVVNGAVQYLGGGILRVDPSITSGGNVSATFALQDPSGLTATGTVTVRVGVENIPLFSPIAPYISGVSSDDAAIAFGRSFLQEYGSTWPNIGPGGGAVTNPPYSSDRGFFTLSAAREPWLYDRATAAWVHWMRSGDTAARTAALAWAELYMANVVSVGDRASFTIDGATDDPKYMYPTIAWWYERETGNTVFRSKAEALYRGLLFTWPKTYVVGPSLWTERGAAFAILGCLAWHAISASSEALDDATEYVDGIIAMSTSGFPAHGHDQHEGDSLTTLITSPWMGAFLAESMVQFYRFTADARILTWLSNYADWLIAHATYVVETPDEPEFASMVGYHLFAYLAGAAGPTDFGQADDMQHARDVAELLRKAKWAKGLLSLSTTVVDQYVAEQEFVATVDDAYWHRATAGLPEDRVNPSRKWAWQHRNNYSGGVYFVGVVPLAPILLTASSISGSQYQGGTLTLTAATWGGRPDPTVTYQWFRDGVAISGQTGLTYDTDGGDVGTTITAVTYATNTGGSDFSTSNGIAILAAGTPQFTVHPANVTREVGQTAVFTVTATGTPAPTLQWQRRATSGDAWANVSEGSGGTTDTYTTEALASGDNGNQVSCLATNVLGSVRSNIATIAMVVQQPAAVFTNTQGAIMATTSPQLGDVGLAAMTITAKVKWTSLTNGATMMAVNAIAGRQISFTPRTPAATTILAVADHLVLTVFPTPPPADTWLDVVLRTPAAAGGAITGTWTLAESADAIYSVTQTSGVEGSLSAQTVQLAAGNAGSGGQAFQVQYVGIYNRRFSDAEVLAQRAAPDYTTAYAFWVFYSNSGALAVRDASGNNRVPTLTGGTVTASGPVAVSIP